MMVPSTQCSGLNARHCCTRALKAHHTTEHYHPVAVLITILMVTFANSTVSNGDVTVNVVVASISIDMTVIIVTTSAATLDYGIVVEVAIVIVAMHEIAAAT